MAQIALARPAAPAPTAVTQEFPLTRARAALVRLAPWLAQSAAAPARALPGESSEDLAQTVLASCLARIERCVRTTGAVPAWCGDDEHLRAYLAGALARHHARRWRDHHREVGLPADLSARTAPEACEVCPCLRALAEDERRMLESGPNEHGELARELGCSRATLHKRRSRARQRLRLRCQECARLRGDACEWLARAR
jgi:DNA-directed RNA polymerase specialized sigma24 family protein